ncbi:MAG: hypothetical protein KJ676_07630 [Alphaproteobacteria bacterium]|nr:hypothetical protein [Alphaproteobacteria bacterium]MBU1527533.1 hypothetical protein [Alphaproteobacteria bacterium]MBU2118392.1 hypothetical protein [Alphaproteobacteria bacterium]MBU2351509.1 hypothetical protein [Alphaproteobacteria bacterium]MBU2383673.1 hypothetical protein [Alphaproteobacteria bacterium]
MIRLAWTVAGLALVQVLTAPTPAQAQSARQALQMTADQYRERFEGERGSRRRPSWLELVEQYGLDRVDRAVRVDHLIHQGRCREARDLANAEGDRNMALRVRQICPGDTGVTTPRGRRMREG